MTRKLFVIDTNVLLFHEDSIHGFPNNDLVIPIEVLEEIDTFKNRLDSVGNAARYVNRFLDQLRKKGSLSEGVMLDNNQMVSVYTGSDLSLLPEGMSDNIDNRVLSVALALSGGDVSPVVITRDISLRVRCDSLGVLSEDYIKEKAVVVRKEAYSGVSVVYIAGEDIDLFYKSGFLDIEESFYPNECIVLKAEGKKSALAIADGKGRLKKLYTACDSQYSVQGISPRSKEQRFALELLMNPRVNMVTLTGMAGSGKTLMSVASAIDQLVNGRYDKVILSRPVQSMSKDIGYLPGTKEEKMSPWLQPIFDNLKHVFKNGQKYLDVLMDKGAIEVEALTYIRGRSIPNAIFIVDEAQNINLAEAKALLTRMGEGSKIILLGDLMQIDSPHLDTATSGLSVVVEMFKDFDLSGHITLIKGERSPLATHAAEIM